MASEVRADGSPLFNFASGVSLMLFYAFAMQCMSTLAVVRKETNSWKWPMVQLFGMTLLAYLVAFSTYQILA
jgi:ferrous iron transport protein B